MCVGCFWCWSSVLGSEVQAGWLVFACWSISEVSEGAAGHGMLDALIPTV